MPHLPFSSKDDLKKSFLENIHFGGCQDAWWFLCGDQPRGEAEMCALVLKRVHHS